MPPFPSCSWTSFTCTDYDILASLFLINFDEQWLSPLKKSKDVCSSVSLQNQVQFSTSQLIYLIALGSYSKQIKLTTNMMAKIQAFS